MSPHALVTPISGLRKAMFWFVWSGLSEEDTSAARCGDSSRHSGAVMVVGFVDIYTWVRPCDTVGIRNSFAQDTRG
jgi:hypothetical protein